MTCSNCGVDTECNHAGTPLHVGNVCCRCFELVVLPIRQTRFANDIADGIREIQKLFDEHKVKYENANQEKINQTASPNGSVEKTD